MVKVSTGGEDANIHPIHGHHGLDSAKAEIYEAEKRAEDVKPPLRKGGMQGGLCPYRGKMLEYAASIRIAKPTTAGHTPSTPLLNYEDDKRGCTVKQHIPFLFAFMPKSGIT